MNQSFDDFEVTNLDIDTRPYRKPTSFDAIKKLCLNLHLPSLHFITHSLVLRSPRKKFCKKEKMVVNWVLILQPFSRTFFVFYSPRFAHWNATQLLIG